MLAAHPISELTGEIELIADAMKRMRSTRLSDDTLYLLIQNAIGQNADTKYRQVPLKTIRLVIEGIEALPVKCFKKEKK
jgi:hypothetical protein